MRSPRVDPTKCFDRVRYRPRRSVKRCDALGATGTRVESIFPREIAARDIAPLFVRECIDRPCSESFSRERRARPVRRCNTRHSQFVSLHYDYRRSLGSRQISHKILLFPAMLVFAYRILTLDCAGQLSLLPASSISRDRISAGEGNAS